MTNILARKRRSPQEEDSSLPSPLVGSLSGSDIENSDDGEEYFNFYGDGNEPVEDLEDDLDRKRDEIEGLPREVYCDLATTLREAEWFLC